jgi:hypothetical protein
MSHRGCGRGAAPGAVFFNLADAVTDVSIDNTSMDGEAAIDDERVADHET